MRIKSLIIAILLCSSTLAQKRVFKQWDATAMRSLSFETDVASSIKISSTNSEQLIISATMEGEYANSLHVGVIRQDDGQWSLITTFESFGDNPDDKLAAHKVKALVLEIQIPQDREVAVSATTASLYLEGNYKNVNAQLATGNCELQNFKGNAFLEVLEGDTQVVAHYGVAAMAASAFGMVQNKLPAAAKYLIQARSNHGNITLRQVPRSP